MRSQHNVSHFTTFFLKAKIMHWSNESLVTDFGHLTAKKIALFTEHGHITTQCADGITWRIDQPAAGVYRGIHLHDGGHRQRRVDRSEAVANVIEAGHNRLTSELVSAADDIEFDDADDFTDNDVFISAVLDEWFDADDDYDIGW